MHSFVLVLLKSVLTGLEAHPPISSNSQLESVGLFVASLVQHGYNIRYRFCVRDTIYVTVSVYVAVPAVTRSLQRQVETLKAVNDNVQHLVEFIVSSEEKTSGSIFYFNDIWRNFCCSCVLARYCIGAIV